MKPEALSYYSDLAFQAVMAAYLVALVCYGVEFAGRRPVATAGNLLAVGALTAAAGNDGPVIRQAVGPGGIGVVSRVPQTGWAERFGRAATAVTLLGCALQVASLIARGLAVGRVPWGNMYEFASMITVVAVGSWLMITLRHGLRSAGFFIMLPVTILVFVAGTVLYTPAVALVPALQSYWLVIHVLAVSLSSGVLLVSGSASAMYLASSRQRRHHNRAFPTAGSSRPAGLVKSAAAVAGRLPSVAALDRVAYRTAVVAFPVYTFAVIAGAMWAESAWGRYWAWDPKETCAFITWMLYAAYLHARATAGWRGRPAAWIAVLGAISILFNLFFINMVIAGLHSYAGLN